MTKRVFICYSHDSAPHADRVLALAERLRADGLDARLDQWVTNPSEGWPKWMERQFVEADALILVCTPTYRRRFERDEVSGSGKGATWEGMLARQVLYAAGSLNEKMIPIYFEDGSADDIPLILQGTTHHRLANDDAENDAGYEALLRQLTDQPRYRAPPIGEVRQLPPVERRGVGLRPGGIRVDNRGATIGTQITAHGTLHLGTLSVTMPTPDVPGSARAEVAAQVRTIVLFSANATLSGHHLQLEKEMASIEAAIRSARCREQYRLRICPAATVATIVRALDELEPDVVHFCGHADRRGRMTLAGQNGSEHHVSPREMAGLFEELAKRPRLTVFATCFSFELAVAVAVRGCHAIGFEGEIYDETASSFSALFYERLASRRELEVARAFKLARIATIASGQPDAERARLVPEPLNVEAS